MYKYAYNDKNQMKYPSEEEKLYLCQAKHGRIFLEK